MTAAQARTVCDDVVMRPRSAEAMQVAIDTLADVAATVSPCVEIQADGAVFCDCTRSALLCASEEQLVSILGARADRQGLSAHVAVAGCKLAASIAAREGGDVRVVPSRDTCAYLAPRALTHLDLDDQVVTTLTRWGLRCIGDLARLPSAALAHRLGPVGARLARQVRGEDDGPLRCRAIPSVFTEAADLDYPIDALEPLLFVVRRLVDRMTSRFALHGHACTALALRFECEGGARDVRHIASAAPTADARVLLSVVRSHLEQHPPQRAVIAVAIEGVPVPRRPTQLDLFQPAGPSPVALAATLARLAALCGPDRVGAPCRAESHRPGAVAIAPFSADTRASQPADTSMGERPARARVILRAFRPAVPLEIFESRGSLDYVRGRVLGGRVVHLAGPWRLRGEWWTDDPFAREYYDVELSDGGVYRIYHDVRRHEWFVDGVYD